MLRGRMRIQKHQEAKWKALLWSKGPQERRSGGDRGTEQRAGSSRERSGDRGHPRGAGRVTRWSFSLQSVIDQRAGPAKAGTSTDWRGFKLAKQVKQPGREKQSFQEPLTLTCSDHADLPAQPWPSLGQRSGSSGEGRGWEGAPESTSSTCPPLPLLLGSWMSARV